MVSNYFSFMGRLTKDVELRDAGENKVANFTLARDRYSKNAEHPEADFVDFIAWNKTAEFLEKYFHKGSRMLVSAHVQTGTYESKKFVDSDGNPAKLKRTDFIVDNVEFCESKSSTDVGGTNNAPKETKEEVVEDDSEELPF